MLLQSNHDSQIPGLTKQVTRAAFPDGSLAITLRDELGPIFDEADFIEIYPSLGQPAESPARLALITILQFAEDLPDRQAANAVRGRIDWKYALGLELTDPGFYFSVLSDFRQRLIENGKERVLLEKLLTQCEAKSLLNGKHKQRTDSTHVLAAIRRLSLLELVGETMHRLLNDLARQTSDWLRLHLAAEWVKRYEHHFEVYRLPKSKEEREALAVQIGQDGFDLLQQIFAHNTPREVQTLPLVAVLRAIWVQQFYRVGDKVYWRIKKEWGAASRPCDDRFPTGPGRPLLCQTQHEMGRV